MNLLCAAQQYVKINFERRFLNHRRGENCTNHICENLQLTQMLIIESKNCFLMSAELF